jgi:17 kDa outer membrane surface antigen
MRLMLKFALPIALSFAVAPVHAQTPLGMSWETYVTLTQGDMDMIKATLAGQIHGKKLGSQANWTNPQSGNSGSITLLKISSRDGRRCEQIEYRNVPPNKTPFDRFVLTSCLQADGSWRLSE